MKETLTKHKTLVIIAAAIALCAIGFAAGMLAKTAMAGSNDYISANKAKTIALENVGVSQEKATFTMAQLDQHNSPAVYDIEFHSSAYEYEFKIHACTGDIMKKNSKAIAAVPDPGATASAQAQPPQNTRNQAPSSSAEYIGVDKAKTIALSHAGISNAHFTKSKLDSDHGEKTYELEFSHGNKEYEYEIHAYTGEILDCLVNTVKHDKHHGHDDHD